jgi:hypothetical protein
MLKSLSTISKCGSEDILLICDVLPVYMRSSSVGVDALAVTCEKGTAADVDLEGRRG